MGQMDEGKQTRRVAVLRCGAAVIAGLMLAGCGSARQPGRPSTAMPGLPVPTSAVHRLTVIADRTVRVNGGHTPAWVSAVVTTYKKALTSATPGDTVPFGEKTIVYLVTMKGHFIAKEASVPAGAHAPTGIYLSLVVNAKTFQATDFGLGFKPPPVSPASLGPVTYLKVSTQGRPALNVATTDCSIVGRELGAAPGHHARLIREIINAAPSGIASLDAAMQRLSRALQGAGTGAPTNRAFSGVVTACTRLGLWHTYH
jgi:hypothetical protein